VADLGQDKLNYLPPQLQKVLRQYEVTGALDVAISGSMPVMQPLRGDVQAKLRLSGANVTLGEYRIPVSDLDLSARLQDGKLHLPELRISALNGSAEASGWALLNDVIDTGLKVDISGMMLQELLATHKAREQPALAGTVNASAELSAPLMVVIAKATPPPSTAPATRPSALARFESMPLPSSWGQATIDVTDARLVRLPMVHDLVESVRSNKAAAAAKPSDRLSLSMEFQHDHVKVTRFVYTGEIVAARGTGSVTLDQKLNLTLNGGPVEKVQSMLGKEVGGAIGMVTDQLFAYHVTGTLGEPQVKVVAGSVVNETTKSVEDTAKKIGEGIGNIGKSIGRIGRREE
jgi:hypothetical protein